ncbi:MAG: AraC family transcriptional regulator [Verrucomicrobiota bacterium]
MPPKSPPLAIRTHVVRSDDLDNREWLRDQPVCRELGQHHISHVEILEASEPFTMTRADQSGTCMMACFGGSGMVKADGQWKRLEAGQACLLPPFVTNRLKATGPEPMKMCTVRYHESREARPILSHKSPVLGVYHSDPLRRAIQGLHAEATGQALPAQLNAWSELIHSYVLRFAQPHQSDTRLWRMWEAIDRELAHPWTLDELAAKACVSKEHLRRLCRSELGRTPMQHVTFLRMRRARQLLTSTGDKIESISRDVGFINPNTFSNTFQKWTGRRPSQVR